MAIVTLAMVFASIGLATGSNIAEASAATQHRWYFAEGFTGDGFQEYLCLGNPGLNEAEVTVEYLFNDLRSLTESLSIPAESRYTIDVNRAVGPFREVSMVVSSARGDLTAERSVYFDYQGRYQGDHMVGGATSTSNTWYFAEGYTGPGFDEYVCVLNPGGVAADLTFRFQSAFGETVIGGESVPAGSRRTFKVNDMLGTGHEVSLRLDSSVPVVAERPMYFEYRGTGSHDWEGGHCVMGATEIANGYLFAEGTTREGFEEWLTLQNPGECPITITAEYLLGEGQGSRQTREYEVEGNRRRTVFVGDEVGEGKDVSVHLSASGAFLAERPMYYGFSHSGYAFQGGKCALGATEDRGEWFFAEGCTMPYYEEWICVQNSSGKDVELRFDYLTQDYGGLAPRTVTVPAGTRLTLLVNDHAGNGLELATRITVVGEGEVNVERPVYFDSSGGMPFSSQSGVLHGLCFAPYLTENPMEESVSVAQVESLMDLVAPYTRWIRTFCSQGEWDAMPRLAMERGMYVACGCDIYTDLRRNQREVDTLVSQVNRGEVDLAVVGDEVLLCDALGEEQLIDYLRQVKATGATTSTSDAWTEWVEHPRLVEECDLLIVNIYPYWEGVSIDRAVGYLDYCYGQVLDVAGGKRIIVETGWPSDGQVVGNAVPTEENAARYLGEFMHWAEQRRVEYFYFEAFDEQWKECREGPCGSHWGLFDHRAEIKPRIAEVIEPRK